MASFGGSSLCADAQQPSGNTAPPQRLIPTWNHRVETSPDAPRATEVPLPRFGHEQTGSANWSAPSTTATPDSQPTSSNNGRRRAIHWQSPDVASNVPHVPSRGHVHPTRNNGQAAVGSVVGRSPIANPGLGTNMAALRPVSESPATIVPRVAKQSVGQLERMPAGELRQAASPRPEVQPAGRMAQFVHESSKVNRSERSLAADPTLRIAEGMPSLRKIARRRIVERQPSETNSLRAANGMSSRRAGRIQQTAFQGGDDPFGMPNFGDTPPGASNPATDGNLPAFGDGLRPPVSQPLGNQPEVAPGNMPDAGGFDLPPMGDDPADGNSLRSSETAPPQPLENPFGATNQDPPAIMDSNEADLESPDSDLQPVDPGMIPFPGGGNPVDDLPLDPRDEESRRSDREDVLEYGNDRYDDDLLTEADLNDRGLGDLDCEEIRAARSANSIRDIVLDISPPFRPNILKQSDLDRARGEFDADQEVRQWRNNAGSLMAEGRFANLAYNQVVVETAYGATETLPIDQ
ncbi:MAG: hypothetical protein AAFP90_09420, partial [Planctomycetota bacterium]